MDCDDMQAATSVIITQRDVKWSSGFHHSHHEALWERSGARTLLNDPTFFQNPEGLIARDAALLCPEQSVVAPPDATGAGCLSDSRKIETHKKLLPGAHGVQEVGVGFDLGEPVEQHLHRLGRRELIQDFPQDPHAV